MPNLLQVCAVISCWGGQNILGNVWLDSMDSTDHAFSAMSFGVAQRTQRHRPCRVLAKLRTKMISKAKSVAVCQRSGCMLSRK